MPNTIRRISAVSAAATALALAAAGPAVAATAHHPVRDEAPAPPSAGARQPVAWTAERRPTDAYPLRVRITA